MGGIGKATDGAGVIEMQVGLDDVFDIRRVEAERLYLIDAALILVQNRPIDIAHAAPMAARVGRHFDRVAAIDDRMRPGG